MKGKKPYNIGFADRLVQQADHRGNVAGWAPLKKKYIVSIPLTDEEITAYQASVYSWDDQDINNKGSYVWLTDREATMQRLLGNRLVQIANQLGN